jgi:hypothetical protein
LETIVKEAARQQNLAAIANATMPAGDAYRVASNHAHVLARLSDVATVVAVYFSRYTLRPIPARSAVLRIERQLTSAGYS